MVTTKKTKKRSTKKQSAARKSGAFTSNKKSGGQKSGKRRSSPGLISRAKKVVGDVLKGAVAGAATGAVVGAAEAGTKATGIDRSSKGGTNAKTDQQRRKASK